MVPEEKKLARKKHFRPKLFLLDLFEFSQSSFFANLIIFKKNHRILSQKNLGENLLGENVFCIFSNTHLNHS